MIKQQIYRRSQTGYRTAAVSASLRESAWLPLLEQQAMLHYGSDLPAPIYYQYPFAGGLVLSRCGVDPNGSHGSYIAHQLVINEQEDIDLLTSLRPLPARVFRDAYVERGDDVDPLPTLGTESLADSALLSDGFKLIDSLFTESLLTQLIQALLWASRDKQQLIHITLNQPPATVSEQGRLLMEMLMRALPAQDVRRLSYCTLLEPSVTAMQYSVCVSPPTQTSSRFSDVEAHCIRFDLTAETAAWPDAAPEADTQSEQIAQALLAHDLNWVDRARNGGADSSRQSRVSSSFRLDTPPFEKGMSLTQYVRDWADALEMRQSVLNEDAFMVLAQEEWPRLIGSVINAADMVENLEFTSQLQECVALFARSRYGETLGMSPQNLADLIAILLDGINWDDVDLFDPACVRLIKTVTGYAELLTEKQCDGDCLTACRAMHALLSGPTQLSSALDGMATLCESNPALFNQLQACARRYVTNRCRAAKDGFEEFALVDETLVAAAIIGYVRFTSGILDLRLLDKVRDTIARVATPADAKRFSAQLDRMRKRIHAAHSNTARKRELRLMLLISLGLMLVIAGVIIYFMFSSDPTIFSL